MERIELMDEMLLSFLVLEAQENAAALEAVLEYGRAVAMLEAAGCSEDEARLLMLGGGAVN